jgi:23S rRNA-intervening sequence protein
VYSSFEEMPVWQKAMDLAEQVFVITESLPRKEDYGLTSQIRSSALSVSNIAEGLVDIILRTSSISTILPVAHWPKPRVI